LDVRLARCGALKHRPDPPDGTGAMDESSATPTDGGRSGRLSRFRTAVLLTLAGALAVAFGAGAGRAAAAEPGVGLNQLSGGQVNEVRALGTHWVRIFVSWRGLQPGPGPIAPSALASYDALFAGLPAGSKVILDVFGTPQWETGSSNDKAPPANPADYGAFVATLARHFQGHVAAYEIWNEEDSSGWWAGGADPAAYARLLRAAYPAIKAAEPAATVVLGGLTGNDYPFLEGVYRAGGKGFFDAVGVHTDTACNVLSPYDFLRSPNNRLIPDSFLGYREVRATMLANGDDKPIWMTELSWRTTSATCPEGAWAGQKPEGVSDEEQATFLTQAYHCLAQDPYVQVALWFPIQDEGSVLSGLVRANGSRKPAFAAMRNYVNNGDTLSEPCGVFTGPKITVASPASRLTFEGTLPIRVSAASTVGVFRIRLLIDGKLIRNYDAPSYPSSLSGAIDWIGAKFLSHGRHTLTFLAYDKERNISEVSVTIFRGNSAPARHHGSHRGPGPGTAGAGGKGAGGAGANAVHKTAKKHPRKHARRHRRARRSRRPARHH